MMARLLIAMLILTLVVLTVGALAAALRPVEAAAQRGIAAARRGPNVPDSVQKIAYVLLIVLMFGVVSGWLGGL